MSEYIIKNNLLGFLNGCFSQWYACDFTIDTSEWFVFFKKTNNPNLTEFYQHYDSVDMPFALKFSCCEQAMMFGKAIIFGDWQSAEKILQTNSPSEQKKLGRKVKNFDEKIWNKIKFRLVVMINMHKFTQNGDLADILESSGHALIVEMASYDPVWGIALNGSASEAWDVSTWKGENLLGRALMQVRENLRNP